MVEELCSQVIMPVPGWSRIASHDCHRAVSRVIASAAPPPLRAPPVLAADGPAVHLEEVPVYPVLGAGVQRLRAAARRRRRPWSARGRRS